MYLSYYGMEYNPFDKDINVNIAYETNDLKMLDNRLNYIKENKGIAVITGNPGTGKTFSVRKFTHQLNPNLYKIIYICLSTVSINEFYHELCYKLDIEPSFKKVDMFKEIQERIVHLVDVKKVNVMIIIDEAQYLKPSILNDLKILFNFNFDSKNYVSLILLGQPILNNILNRNIYEALKQRITISYNMSGITKEELIEYINSRLIIAKGNKGIFSEQALEAIYNASNGSIRIANNIITKSLIIGKSKNKQALDTEDIMEACNELELG